MTYLQITGCFHGVSIALMTAACLLIHAKDVQVSWVSISQILSNKLLYLSLALKNVDDRMELIKKTNSVMKKGGF